jgi:glycerol-3-phosphate acyltransferase PlsY
LIEITNRELLVYLASFIVGSLPFAIIIGKVFYGIDVRKHGSGNPGATNTLRTLGAKAGVAVLLLDIGKGALGVALVKWIPLYHTVAFKEQMVIAGACAILGHVFSPFLRFSGGKGMATTVGVMLALDPLLGLGIVGLFTLILFLSRYVSLASILSVAAFSIIFLATHYSSLIICIFSVGIFLLILVKHRSNIGRLINGKENRFVFNKAG